MLISFEGIDGCGKSTQISMLEEWCARKEIPAAVFREPGGTVLSEKIRDLLLDGRREMNPVTELLLFSAARSQLISEQVKPLLDAGRWVILDRFYDSTTAYQGFGRRSADLKEIDALNRLAAHNLEPDFTFYLKIGVEEASKRTSGREKDRMESSGEEFYRRVIRGFDQLSSRFPRFVTLDATQSPEAIHTQITTLLQEKPG